MAKKTLISLKMKKSQNVYGSTLVYRINAINFTWTKEPKRMHGIKLNKTWEKVAIELCLFEISDMADMPYSFDSNLTVSHCVKSVRVRSYSGPYFPAFGMNTDRHSVSLRIQSKCGNIWTIITPNTDTFYAVSRYATKPSWKTDI